ncbi:hypothetical protein FRB98_003444 [Tulasnella sp. 332]|nr:hypothetical protein FRB98_003444 [Tulasnella sp. 332]
MPVMTAENLMAQAKLLANGGTAFNPAPRPRDHKKNPNPTAAGGVGAEKARMSYYIPGPPQPVTRRPSKPLPRRVNVPVPAPAGLNKPEEAAAPGSYSEYDLAPAPPDSWKLDIMTFKPANKDHKVDIRDFQPPIRLNRKNPKSMIYAEPDPKNAKATELVPMKGPDGNPVYHNGEMVMVGPDGQTTVSAMRQKERAAANASGKGKGKAADGVATAPAKKKGPMMKKKTKQTFKAPEEVRAKRKEEYLPWFLDEVNGSGNQEWVGAMNGLNDDEIYAIFRIDGATGRFELVPAHRYYDFRPKKQMIAAVRADDAHERFAKGKTINLAAGFAARNGGKVTKATLAFQTKVEQRDMEELKPMIKRGGRDDDDLFGEGGSKREMPNFTVVPGSQEGDVDEMDYEEDMADDDEGDRHEEMAEDEEEKRTQDRLKKEWIAANKAGEEGLDDSDDDLDLSGVASLNEDGKRVMKSLVKNEGYDDDSESDDEDGYAKRYGVKKEPKEDDTLMTMATGVQEQVHKVRKPPVPAPDPKPAAPPTPATTARPSPPVPTSSTANPPSSSRNSVPPVDFKSRPAGQPASRAVSPAAPSGSAVVAMRATSPKRSNAPLGRATSPLAGSGRAGSPLAGPSSAGGSGHATSPPATPVSQANAATINAKKRKDPPAASGTPGPSATAAAAPTATAAPGGPVAKKKKVEVKMPTAEDVVEFIRSKGGAVTAKDLALRFKTKDNPTLKMTLIGLVKQVAKMDNGMVVIPPST